MTTRSLFFLVAAGVLLAASLLVLSAFNRPDPITRALAVEVDRSEADLTRSGVARLEVMSPSHFPAGTAAAYLTDASGNEQVLRVANWPSSIPELAITCQDGRCHASATAVRGQASPESMRVQAVRVIDLALSRAKAAS